MVFLRPVLAVLYDIHGNLPALEAVLADAHDNGAGAFVLGGDYAAFGAWPAQTVARLDELAGATWIRGNWERWLATWPADDVPDSDVPRGAAGFALERLAPETVARLAALPPDAVLDDTLFCHASPGSDMRGVSREPSGEDADRFTGVTARRVVFGHTHLQFARRWTAGDAAIDLVNPGSVGLPFDGDPRAAYALLHPGGEAELRRVAYDHHASAAAVRAIERPWARAIGDAVERGALG